MAQDFFHHQWNRVDIEKASQQYDELWSFLPQDFSLLLDVGGGIGAVNVSLQRVGKKQVAYTVLDGSRSAIEQSSKRNIEGVLHDLDSGPMPFEDNSFDMVFAIDVLEHIMNPWAVLAECRRVSSKYVFVHGPNFAHWRARMTELLGNPNPQMVANKHGAVVNGNGDHVSHIYFITYSNLLFWAEKAGLKVIKKRVFWYRRYAPLRWFLEPFCGNFGSQYQILFEKVANHGLNLDDPNLSFPQ